MLPQSTKKLLGNPFFRRVIIFISLFVLVSGIIGPWVISTKLLYDYHFFIYGNLGKLVILSAIIFAILAREKLVKIKVEKYDLRNVLYLIASSILIMQFFNTGTTLLAYKSFNDNLTLSFLTHANLIAVPLLILFGVFGLEFVKKFTHDFKKEILICIGISAVLFVSIFQVWKLWPIFSGLVLQVVYLIFSHLYSNVHIIPPFTLFVRDFGVEIAQACSGLESIFLFTVLYVMIGAIDWKKLNKTKLFALYPALLAGLVVVNIIRVTMLIWIGIIINPQIMVELFHTYLGMILFIIYFLFFLRYAYGWMKK